MRRRPESNMGLERWCPVRTWGPSIRTTAEMTRPGCPANVADVRFERLQTAPACCARYASPASVATPSPPSRRRQALRDRAPTHGVAVSANEEEQGPGSPATPTHRRCWQSRGSGWGARPLGRWPCPG